MLPRFGGISFIRSGRDGAGKARQPMYKIMITVSGFITFSVLTVHSLILHISLTYSQLRKWFDFILLSTKMKNIA